jgi:multisubunit Na+/H+ antiporter MnhB subunit
VSSDDKLWRYARLARLWSWALIGTAVALLALSVALEAGRSGLDARWFAAAFGITGVTGVLLFPLFRVWLRRTALPSVRLAQATRATGPRRLEATPADWRRWSVVTALVLLVGGFALLVFLVGVLGPGGTAEGVVVGMIAAWGAATLEDVRRIRRAEEAEGRRYYAACRRPTSVGDRLVWVPGVGRKAGANIPPEVSEGATEGAR